MKDQQKKQPQDPEVHNPSKTPGKDQRKSSVENPDKNDQPNPGKEPKIDDDPDQTMKKIPVEKGSARES